jgi:alkyl sulfatase BDS1-like metallo-beta-lactamase superfamily hydrolase
MKIGLLGLVLASSTAAAASDGLANQAASDATVQAQKAVLAALPAEDGRDADFASRGFIATLADPIIRNAKGNVVWDLNAYNFVEGGSPDTVNPSLWRHAGLLRKHGLFKVAGNVWQVRGFDVSNMTVIKGDTGWILIDPLTSREMGAAAPDLQPQPRRSFWRRARRD